MPAKTRACRALQLDRSLRWARLELEKIQNPANPSTQTAEGCLQVHTQSCTYAQSTSHTSSCQRQLSLQNKLVKNIMGYPPHKPLGNITPKVFHFDAVVYYQINQVRRKWYLRNYP